MRLTEPRGAESGHELDRVAGSRTSAARVSPSTTAGRLDARAAGAPGPHREVRPHLDRVVVEAPRLERRERFGRRWREQEVGAGRVDLGLQRLGQLGAQAAVEHPVPGPADRVGVGERAHVDVAAATRARPAPSCGAAPGTPGRGRLRPHPGGAPTRARAPSTARRRSRVRDARRSTTNATAIASGESFSTSITTTPPSPSPTAYTRSIASPPGIRTAVCTTGAGCGRDCARPARRAPGTEPVVAAADAPTDPQRALVHGAVGRRPRP